MLYNPAKLEAAVTKLSELVSNVFIENIDMR